jgi:hypothetical protein
MTGCAGVGTGRTSAGLFEIAVRGTREQTHSVNDPAAARAKRRTAGRSRCFLMLTVLIIVIVVLMLGFGYRFRRPSGSRNGWFRR